MRKNLPFFLIILFVILSLAACAPVGVNGGRVITGGTYTLNSGETLDSNMVMLGGQATLKDGSHINGDLSVFGGNIDVNGEINGNITMFGGNMNLGPQTVIRGSLSVSGGNVNRSSSAKIEGNVSSGNGFDIPTVVPIPSRSAGGQFAWFVFQILMQAALAALIVIFMPAQVARTARAIFGQMTTTAGIGFLSIIALPVLMLLFVFTLILIPVSLIGILVMFVAITFGWTAIGLEVGQRIARAMKWDIQPAIEAGLGTLALAFVANGIGMIPFVGWLAPLAISILALGGVILTRFGTQEYVPSVGTVAPPQITPQTHA